MYVGVLFVQRSAWKPLASYPVPIPFRLPLGTGYEAREPYQRVHVAMMLSCPIVESSLARVHVAPYLKEEALTWTYVRIYMCINPTCGMCWVVCYVQNLWTHIPVDTHAHAWLILLMMKFNYMICLDFSC